MSKFIGRQQEVGLAVEATRGTFVAPTLWIPKTDFSVEDKANKATFRGNYGSVAAVGDDSLVTEQWSEGSLAMELQDQPIAYLLYAALGTLTSASFNGAYKHSLALLESVQCKTLSLLMRDPIGTTDDTVNLAYAMAMLDSLEISCDLGELVKVAAEFQAKAHQDFTVQSPSYTAHNKFAHRHVTVKVAADEASLDAASRVNVRSFRLKIERNVERENSLGTVQPVDIMSRAVRISGSMQLTYEDRTYRDYMLNGTKKALRLGIVNDGVTIGTTNPQVQIDLPVVHFHDWEPAVDQDEVATQEISFEALYDATNSQLIGSNSFVVNEQSAY